MPLAAIAAIGVAGSIGGAAIQGSAAGNAASAQSHAAEQAAALQHQDAQEALKFQALQYQNSQGNQAPFIRAGQGAVNNLATMMFHGTGPFSQWDQKFVPPTGATEQNDPGYQFRLDQGTRALQNSAAARGDLLSGNTLADTTKFGQDYASNEYGNVYNRALGQYQQNYNIFKQNQADQFNRLASLAGEGQTAVGQLGSEGQAAANNAGNILLNSGQQVGQNINNAAAATASGYIGGANAWGGALNGGTQNLLQLMMLKNLYGSGGSVDLSGVPMSPPGYQPLPPELTPSGVPL